MTRDKKTKKNEFLYPTDLSEHCKWESNTYQNQFTKFSQERTKEMVLKLNNGDLPPLMNFSKELIKAQSIQLNVDNGNKAYDKESTTFAEV